MRHSREVRSRPARHRMSSGCSLHLRFLALRPTRAEVFAGLLVDLAHAELDLAPIVEAQHLDFDIVAELDDIGDFADPLRGEFADVNEPVARSEKIHESAEVDDFYDLAIVNDAEFGFGHDAANPVDRGLRRISVNCGDLDGAIVVYIDLGPGRLDDLPDDFAAGTDDLADLFLRNAEAGDPRRIVADGVAGARQSLGHLPEDVIAAVPRLIQRNPHDLLGDRGDLDVHLQCGNALLGAGDLEVHVAEMILVAEDIREYGKSLRLFDQPHGDPRDRPRQRHPGIHQRKRGAAHRGHRRRTVRFRDLRNDADRIREAVLAGEQRMDGPPSEFAVPDLPSPGRTHPTGFTRGIGREVVVKHKVFAILALERVDHLLVLTRS